MTGGRGMEGSSDGMCLSEQLSQVRLVAAASPRLCDGIIHSLNDEDSRHSADPGSCQSDIEDRRVSAEVEGDMESDYICSQDFFCTPDFITPVEQQFSIDLEGNKEKRVVPPSPLSLTVMRSKRRRPEDVGVLLSSALMDGNRDAPKLSTELPYGCDHVDVLPLPVFDSKESSVNFSHSSLRVRLSTLRKRVQNPPCVQNPFLPSGDGGGGREGRSKCEAYQSPSTEECSSRYRDDFEEIKEIGRGCFSRVYKSLHRIDGCFYAVKRTHHQLHQDRQRKEALVEVQALASLGSHPNVVRYHSAWFENNYLYTQTELCSCNLTELQAAGELSGEKALVDVLWQVSQALALIHSRGFAHLDVKPDNIYVLDGVYKLGDFGRASRLDGTMHVEEGDSRYTSFELLNDEHGELEKADVFARGATMYELTRGMPLPSSGVQFQALRQGKLALLTGFSLQFQGLLKDMMHPTAKHRPTAIDVLTNIIFRDRNGSPMRRYITTKPTAEVVVSFDKGDQNVGEGR